jgi:hypothetical protein
LFSDTALPLPIASNMGPDDTKEGAFTSTDVCTLMPIESGAAAPIVKPLMVTVNAVVFLMAAPIIVNATVVLFVAPHVTFRPITLLAPVATTGVTNGAKKLGGYVKTKVPPDGMEASGQNSKVTETLPFPAIRSNEDMISPNLCMGPDETGKVRPPLVDIVIPKLLPTLAAPMVRPVSVILMAELALIAIVPVVMTIDVAVGSTALPVAPELIATPGVDEAAKKSLG